MSELITDKLNELKNLKKDLKKDLKKELHKLDRKEESEDNTRKQIEIIQAIAKIGLMEGDILEYQQKEGVN